MTPRQKELARHALGLPNKARKSYRNRFLANPAGSDWQTWSEMVDAGHAEHYPTEGKPFDLFCLTRAGAERALEGKETLCGEDFPPISAH